MANRIEKFEDHYELIPQKEWEPVEIPTKTVMDDDFPTIRINTHEFFPGKKYKAPPSYVEHIKELINRVQRDAVRRLRPTKDLESIRQQAQFGESAGAATLIG